MSGSLMAWISYKFFLGGNNHTSYSYAVVWISFTTSNGTYTFKRAGKNTTDGKKKMDVKWTGLTQVSYMLRCLQ